MQLSTLYHNSFELETDLDIRNSIANGFRHNIRNCFRNIRMVHALDREHISSGVIWEPLCAMKRTGKKLAKGYAGASYFRSG